MATKRIQRCWPASLQRRSTFLPPTQYTDRIGRSASWVLTRAKQSVDTLLAFLPGGGEWDMLSDVEQRLPGRAEDLLLVVLHQEGLAHQRRGYRLADVAEAYAVPVCEAQRAVAALGDWLFEHRTRDDITDFSISASSALTAIKDAHYHLEREPIIP